MEHSMRQYVNKDEMLKAVMAENEQLRSQLAAVQQSVQDAEPAAWVATFKPEGLLALHSVVGANLEELKQSVPGNSVFRPLYTRPTTQGLEKGAPKKLPQRLIDQLAENHGLECVIYTPFARALEKEFIAAQSKQGEQANG